MDQELNFSLSYEQLFQEAEDQIKKCDHSKEGPYYVQELAKARDFQAFWHRLALKGKTGPIDASFYDRVEADWEHLDALIRNGRGAV
ncbi:hypothetical protein LSB85_004673 [Salmonella enterica]|nr:hypothetical protein [Salmonella enterica]